MDEDLSVPGVIVTEPKQLDCIVTSPAKELKTAPHELQPTNAVSPSPILISAKTPVPDDNDPIVWSNARKVYWNYFFAAWGARMWEFAAIVFIMDGLFPSSLLASSLFGLFEALAGIFGSGPAGHILDNRNRLTVLRMAIVTQNCSVMAAMIVLGIALVGGGPSLDFLVRAGILAIVVALGVSSRFGSMLDKMCVNKDWLVVIAAGNRNVQSQINASVRRIDMVCQILAPMGVGLGSSFLGPASTCVLVFAWAFFSVFIEFRLAGIVYAAIPALAQPRKAPAPAPQTSSLSLSDSENSSRSVNDVGANTGFFARALAWLNTTRAAFAAYSQHECLWVSIPYCMLYVSVLSFGGIMVSYLKTLGCSDDLLSAGRGLAALVAIGPTFVVPNLIPRKGLYTTAKWMIWAQIACLIPIVVGFISGLEKDGVETIEVKTFDHITKKEITKTTTTMPVLFIVLVFVSICLSRFGLWGFDLAQTQMMQELVHKSEVGKVNGAQELMLNWCWMFSFALTMIFSSPSQFMWPTYISFAMVLGAGIVYTFKGMHIGAAIRERDELSAKKTDTSAA